MVYSNYYLNIGHVHDNFEIFLCTFHFTLYDFTRLISIQHLSGIFYIALDAQKSSGMKNTKAQLLNYYRLIYFRRNVIIINDYICYFLFIVGYYFLLHFIRVNFFAVCACHFNYFYSVKRRCSIIFTSKYDTYRCLVLYDPNATNKLLYIDISHCYH